MKRITMFMLGLVVTFFFVNPTFAESTKVSLRVDGLACPFCAYGLEKKLKKIEGVEKLEIKINDGLVTLHYKADAKIDKEEISKKVKEAGFTPKEITIKDDGEKTMPGEKITLNIKGMTCEGCVGRVEKALTKIDCVYDVKVTLVDEKAEFFCSKEKADLAEFTKTIEVLGFKADVAKSESN